MFSSVQELTVNSGLKAGEVDQLQTGEMLQLARGSTARPNLLRGLTSIGRIAESMGKEADGKHLLQERDILQQSWWKI